MPATRRRSRDQKRLPSQPDIPYPQKSVSPGDDFYKYVNGEWLRRVNMPPYMTSYGISEEIEDIVNKECMEILQKARYEVRSKADKHIPHTTYLLGTLTESVLNTHVQQNNIKFVQGLINNVKCLRSFEEIIEFSGFLVKHRIPSLLNAIVINESEKSDQLRLAITYGSLGLPDPSYYEKPNSDIVIKYSHLLKKLGEYFDVSSLDQCIPLETEFAKILKAVKEEKEEMLKGSTIKKKYKNIFFEKYIFGLLGWSPSKLSDQTIIMFSPTWLKFLDQTANLISLDQWKTILCLNIILHFLFVLPPPFDDLHFELYGKKMRDQTEKIPQNKLALYLAQEWLTGSLGFSFVRDYVPPSVKYNATTLVKDILDAAADRTKDLDWLEPKTKQIARKKIINIYPGIAYPGQIKKDKNTTLNSQNCAKNIFDLGQLDFEMDAKKINKKMNRYEWDDPIFSVNAFYYSAGNRFVLPAGILRWPFFHVAATDGWNYGGIGATIGHEICHAFDMDGKDYDENGNKNPWWNKKEVEKFEEKTKALVNLYNKTEYFGRHLNGSLTLSENIADLGGLAIALAALKKRLAIRNCSKDQYKKELCEFFMSYAVSWRTKEKKKKAYQSLFMDVHSPPVARVNNIVSQFDEWYECFNIKPENKLYKPPEQRIRIF